MNAPMRLTMLGLAATATFVGGLVGCEKQEWLEPKAPPVTPVTAQLPLDQFGGTGNSSIDSSPNLTNDPYVSVPGSDIPESEEGAQPSERGEPEEGPPDTRYFDEGVGGSGPQEQLPEDGVPAVGAPEGREDGRQNRERQQEKRQMQRDGDASTDAGGGHDTTMGTGGAGMGTDSDRAEGLSDESQRDTGE